MRCWLRVRMKNTGKADAAELPGHSLNQWLSTRRGGVANPGSSGASSAPEWLEGWTPTLMEGWAASLFRDHVLLKKSPVFGKGESPSSVLLSKWNFNKCLCKWGCILVECIIIAPIVLQCYLISTTNSWSGNSEVKKSCSWKHSFLFDNCSFSN